MIAIASGMEGGGGGGGGARSSSSETRDPDSRSRPQVEQIDIPTGTTPPQVGQRRAFNRASAALGRRFAPCGLSSNRAKASAVFFIAEAEVEAGSVPEPEP